MLFRNSKKSVLKSMAIGIKESELDFSGKSSKDLPAGYTLDELTKKANFKSTGISKQIKQKNGDWITIKEYFKNAGKTKNVAFYSENYGRVIFCANLVKNNINNAQVINASVIYKTIRRQGLGILCYEALFQIYGKLQGDKFQSEGARALWVRLAQLGEVDLVRDDKKQLIQKNIRPESITDGRVWLTDTDEDEDSLIFNKTIEHYVLLLKKLNTGNVK